MAPLSTKLAILFIHGAYHPPTLYSPLIDKLREVGYNVTAPRLASLGKDKHGATNADDIAVIRDAAEPLFKSHGNVVLLAHSIGGFIATFAVKGYTVPERRAEGKEGGFAGLVYMNSSLPVNREDTVMSMCDPASAAMFDIDVREDGKMVSFLKNDPESRALALHMFYSSCPQELAIPCLDALERFSTDNFAITASVLPSDLDMIPRTYIIGEQDVVVPLAGQEKMVEHTPGMKSVRLKDCGHSPFLTHVDDVVKAVEDFVGELA